MQGDHSEWLLSYPARRRDRSRSSSDGSVARDSVSDRGQSRGQNWPRHMSAPREDRVVDENALRITIASSERSAARRRAAHSIRRSSLFGMRAPRPGPPRRRRRSRRQNIGSPSGSGVTVTGSIVGELLEDCDWKHQQPRGGGITELRHGEVGTFTWPQAGTLPWPRTPGDTDRAACQ